MRLNAFLTWKDNIKYDIFICYFLLGNLNVTQIWFMVAQSQSDWISGTFMSLRHDIYCDVMLEVSVNEIDAANKMEESWDEQ